MGDSFGRDPAPGIGPETGVSAASRRDAPAAAPPLAPAGDPTAGGPPARRAAAFSAPLAALYVTDGAPAGGPPPDAAFAGPWVENQGIALPLDDRIFAAPALALVARGKFERGLTRHLPGLLPRGARVLDLGAATGFLALLLARRRPDLMLVAQEEDSGLQQAFGWVCARNAAAGLGGVALNPTPLAGAADPAAALAGLLRRHRPEALLLGAPPAAWAPGLVAALQAARPGGAAADIVPGTAPDTAPDSGTDSGSGPPLPLPALLMWHGRGLATADLAAPGLARPLASGLAALGYAPPSTPAPGQLIVLHRAAQD